MVFRRNQNRIKHSVLILLQLISRNYKNWMRKNRTVRHYKRNLNNFSLLNRTYNHFSIDF